jgi:hypothetical protein
MNCFRFSAKFCTYFAQNKNPGTKKYDWPSEPICSFAGQKSLGDKSGKMKR